jgi:uncharacterized protein (TIGR03083 family)
VSVDVTRLAREERGDLAGFLATLTPPQWEAPTLCERWRVRDVVAHLISYDDLDARGLLRRLARARLDLDRANALGVAAYDQLDPPQLLECLTERVEPRGLPARFGGRVALVDGLIHHQDIRRPLGRPREVPPDRLRVALNFALVAPPIRGLWRARGLRLVATDLDWAAGRGQLVEGPAEALLMAIAGRRGVTDQLTGPVDRFSPPGPVDKYVRALAA